MPKIKKRNVKYSNKTKLACYHTEYVNPYCLNSNQPYKIIINGNTYMLEKMDEIVDIISKHNLIYIQSPCGQGKTTLINSFTKHFEKYIVVNGLSLAKEQNEQWLQKSKVPFSTSLSNTNNVQIYSITQHHLINHFDKMSFNPNAVLFDESQWIFNYNFLTETDHTNKTHVEKLIQIINSFYGKVPIVFFSATNSILSNYGHYLGVDCVVEIHFENTLIKPKQINWYQGNTDLDIKDIILNEVLNATKQVYIAVDVGTKQLKLNINNKTIKGFLHFSHQAYSSAFGFMESLQKLIEKHGKTCLCISSKTEQNPEVQQALELLKTKETLTDAYNVIIVSSKAESGFNIKHHNVENVVVISHDVDFIQQSFARFRTNCPILTLIYRKMDTIYLPNFTTWEISKAFQTLEIINNLYNPTKLILNLAKMQAYKNFYSGEIFWKTIYGQDIVFNYMPTKINLKPTKFKQFFNSKLNTNIEYLYNALSIPQTLKQLQKLFVSHEISTLITPNTIVLRQTYDANRHKKVQVKTIFTHEFNSLSLQTFTKLYNQTKTQTNVSTNPHFGNFQTWFNFENLKEKEKV